jgi:hypothetical protein
MPYDPEGATGIQKEFAARGQIQGSVRRLLKDMQLLATEAMILFSSYQKWAMLLLCFSLHFLPIDSHSSAVRKER